MCIYCREAIFDGSIDFGYPIRFLDGMKCIYCSSLVFNETRTSNTERGHLQVR